MNSISYVLSTHLSTNIKVSAHKRSQGKDVTENKEKYIFCYKMESQGMDFQICPQIHKKYVMEVDPQSMFPDTQTFS